jgi:protein-tyrosine phosphatase
VEKRFFRMVVRGVRPVLAHPERYFPLVRSTKPIEGALRAGALALLDITALAGKYGKGPQRAAERMLDEGVYYAASSDAHSFDDVGLTKLSIERLKAFIGEQQVVRLLSENPANILEGRVGDLG